MDDFSEMILWKPLLNFSMGGRLGVSVPNVSWTEEGGERAETGGAYLSSGSG